MKHSVLKRIICAVLCCVVAIPMFAACSPKKRGDNYEADKSKTQLYVFNYEAGYGKDWVDSLIERFEKACSNISFEEGKKGVQVRYAGAMKGFTSADVAAQDYNILFTENDDYYDLSSSSAILDLTDVITNADMTITAEGGKSFNTLLKEAYSDGEGNVIKTANEYGLDGATIWSRLNTQQQSYLNKGTDSAKKVFAVPSYASSYGIIYDRQRFEDQGYFIVDNGDDEIHVQCELGMKSKPKADGPDGQSGTYDDGLPATYEEFFKLCEVISNKGDVPICWPGMYYEQHVMFLAYSLINDYLGYDGTVTNYSFDGDVEVIKYENNNFQFNPDGTPITETVHIDQANSKNGYELNRLAALYYAIDFTKSLMTSSVSHYYDKSLDETVSHTDNQLNFMEGGVAGGTKHITMLVDGAWWQREATPGARASKYLNNPNYAYEHKYGWLPLPKATDAKVGSDNILSDSLNAFMYVKKTGMNAGQTEAAKAFVLFANCYDSLLDFTKITGTVKGLKYEIEGSDYNSLSPFTKSYLDYASSAKQVYGFSDNPFFTNNSKTFKMNSRYSAQLDGSLRKDIAIGIRFNPSITAKAYLKEIYNYNKGTFQA